MKPLFSCIFLVLISTACFAQGKVGIGTNTPSTPLDIVSQNNWDLINGEGDVRIGTPNYRLKIGVATGGGGAGAASIMQFGVPNGYNVLTLGSQGKQVLYINGTTGFAGIGTASPVSLLQVAGTITSNQLLLNGNSGAPLSFSNILGKKINLFTGTAGNVGFGVYGNELRMHTDYSGADITFGFELNGGDFAERLRIKGNGAVLFNGNSGAQGQILMSRGINMPPTWVAKPSVLHFNQTAQVVNESLNANYSNIPGLDFQAISITQQSKIVFSTTLALSTELLSRPLVIAETTIKNANGQIVGLAMYRGRLVETVSTSVVFQGLTGSLPPGIYNIYTRLTRLHVNEGPVFVNTNSICSCQGGQTTVQIFQE